MSEESQNTEFQPRKFFASLWHVTAGLTARSYGFFEDLSREKKYWPSVIYYLVLGTLALLGVAALIAIAALVFGIPQELSDLNIPGWVLPVVIAMGVLFAPISMLASVGLLHLGILIFASADNKGFHLSWKIYFYVSGLLAIPSTVLFIFSFFVPGLSLLTAGWVIFLLMAGVKILHDTSWGRAALAVLIPQFIIGIVVGTIVAVVTLAALIFFLIAGPLGDIDFEEGTPQASYEEIQEVYNEVPLLPTELPQTFEGGQVFSWVELLGDRPDDYGIWIEYERVNRFQVIRVEQHPAKGRIPEGELQKGTIINGITVYESIPRMNRGSETIHLRANIDGIRVEIEGDVPQEQLLKVMGSMEPITGDTEVFTGEWSPEIATPNALSVN